MDFNIGLTAFSKLLDKIKIEKIMETVKDKLLVLSMDSIAANLWICRMLKPLKKITAASAKSLYTTIHRLIANNADSHGNFHTLIENLLNETSLCVDMLNEKQEKLRQSLFGAKPQF